ncbi:hypothetical protein AMTRI_Chr05g68640 [Amborella trichopoda]
MATSPDGGQLISLLLKLINTKKTIEIGVFTGYSLLATTISLPDDGKVVAIDINKDVHEEHGMPIIKKAGVAHKISFIHSPAMPILDELLQNSNEEGSFDFAYVDADKANYENHHDRLLKLVKVGGLIMYDNTLWGGTVAQDESSVSDYMKPSRRIQVNFNRALAMDPSIKISQIPVGDGLILAVRT